MYISALHKSCLIMSSSLQIPLRLLRRLSHEFDVSQVFEKYVSNVKLQEVKGQKYLVDLSGEPIDAGLGGTSGIRTRNKLEYVKYYHKLESFPPHERVIYKLSKV